MEGQISNFCETLATFLTHIESSTKSLAQSVNSRPIPLDYVASSFLRQLNSRVSSAASDLELLESMAFGTVSFEELLGHFGEAYKTNQSYIEEIEERLVELGYVPESDPVDENEEFEVRLGPESVTKPLVPTPTSIAKNLEQQDLFDDSMSLRNFGFSDICLATLAFNDEDDQGESSGNLTREHAMDGFDSPNLLDVSADSFTCINLEKLENLSVSKECSTKNILRISKNDYDDLPSYVKNLASWEDLLEGVNRINSELLKHDRVSRSYSFTEIDLQPLGFGNKTKTYLLLLLKMKSLSVETVNSSAIYTVVR